MRSVRVFVERSASVSAVEVVTLEEHDRAVQALLAELQRIREELEALLSASTFSQSL